MFSLISNTDITIGVVAILCMLEARARASALRGEARCPQGLFDLQVTDIQDTHSPHGYIASIDDHRPKLGAIHFPGQSLTGIHHTPCVL